MDNNINVQNPAEEMELLEKAKAKKKSIITVSAICAVFLLIGLAFFAYNYYDSKKADKAVGAADLEMIKGLPNDSTVQALYVEAAAKGHKSGDRAALMAAAKYYQDGNYEQAINYLKKASGNSSIAEAGKYSLMGDCYVNMKNYEEALNAFNKGIKAADKNPQIVPFLLVKEANVYRALGKYNEEYAAYTRILNEFPAYVNSHSNVNFTKYAERAKASAEANK